MHRIKPLLILFNISVFLFSCTSPGSLIDGNVSDNYYYNGSKTAVIFADMGGECYAIGCEEVEGADIDTFEPLNSIYARDKNYAYYEHERIAGADANTFKPLGEIYASDKNDVYYRNKRLPDERPGDFKALDGAYAVGTNAVYWAGEVVPSADPNTFEVVAFQIDTTTRYYGKDKNAIFCLEKHLSDQPTLFRPLNNDGYFVDGKDVYYAYSCESLGADPTTFEFLYKKDGSGSHYGKDSENVFLLGVGLHSVIEGADTETFEVLLCSGDGSREFAKDKNHVYTYGTVVEGANPKTFELPEECK